MTERVAIIDGGVRTPFCKANGSFKDMEADELGAYAVRELIARTGVNPNDVDELIFGNVIQPPHLANIARIVALKGGLPEKTPAYTVNRNCSSGMQSIVDAMYKIQRGEGSIYIVGGTESMTHFPILYRKEMREWLLKFSKARSFMDKLKLVGAFRPRFLVPEMPKIYDPLCGLTMGQTAEVLSREFKVTREEQDAFSVASNERAVNAQKAGRFNEEIVPVPVGLKYNKIQESDDGPRAGTTMEGLGKLKPVFDKLTGSVTAATSSQVTDGAVALLLMSESKAKKLGYKPIGYIVEHAAAGVDPRKMGLGPAFAISKVLEKAGKNLSDIDLIEINEAFAAQVVAVEKALASDEFAVKELGRDKAVGQIDRERLNVNGGAIAIGHPLGASGARLVLTLVKELNHRKKRFGIASLCIGGGQGQAVIVEVE